MEGLLNFRGYTSKIWPNICNTGSQLQSQYERWQVGPPLEWLRLLTPITRVYGNCHYRLSYTIVSRVSKRTFSCGATL